MKFIRKSNLIKISGQLDSYLFRILFIVWDPTDKIEFAKHLLLQFTGNKAPRFLFDLIFICIQVKIDCYKIKELNNAK